MLNGLSNTEKIFWSLFGASLIVYCFFMVLDVMQVDAAQYASMSLQMMQSGDYLEVQGRGRDYLDKPPLLFWLSSYSLDFFGIGNFQFKLPSVLASLLSVFSIFKIAKMFYSKKVAYFAAIVLTTSEAIFFTTNDVRTDNLLFGFATFSIWQILRYLEKPTFSAGIFAGIGIGFAMLAKGPLGFIFPMLAIGPHILYKRELGKILNLKWLVAVPVLALMLTPMCIGLYNQYGSHGLYFYFWEQSFGRITGENVWKNDQDPFFMIHTFFWAILPWTFLFIISFFHQVKTLFKSRFKPSKELPEIVGLSGYFLSTLALSQSEYKLPHYIFVAIPAGGLMVANYLNILLENPMKWVISISHVFNILLLAFAVFVGSLFVESMLSVALISIIALTYLVLYFLWRKKKIVWLIAVTGIAANLILSNWFFKPVLKYQTTPDVARKIKEMGEVDRFVSYNAWGFALDFYAEKPIPYPVSFDQLVIAVKDLDTMFIYTKEPRLKDLEPFLEVEVLEEYDHFGVNRLKPKFLNPATRLESTHKRLLVKAIRKKSIK